MLPEKSSAAGNEDRAARGQARVGIRGEMVVSYR